MKLFLTTFATITTCIFAFAQKLSVPPIFSDQMILQQDTKVNIWGTGIPNTSVTLKGSWNFATTTKVNESGKWSTQIETPKADFKKLSLQILNKEDELNIANILTGEVWFCSGQSNMDMPLKGWGANNFIENSEEEISNANYPNIIMFNAKKKIAATLQKEVFGNWKITTPENAKNFSATAYYFARNLYKELNVPIGIVHSSHGSSAAEAWMSSDALEKVVGFKNIKQDLATIKKNTPTYNQFKSRLSKLQGARNIKNLITAETNDELYTSNDFDDSKWKTINIKKAFSENEELKKISGIVYYRKTFSLTKEQLKAKNLSFKYPKTSDTEFVFINGKKIGNSLDSKGNRNFEFSKKYLKKGLNTVTIKIFKIWGDAYFKKAPAIYSEDIPLIKLTGDWKYYPIAEILSKTLHIYNTKDNYYNQPEIAYRLNETYPTGLYNGMLKPLIPFTVKGFTWYQGESNTNKPEQYRTLFPELIQSWRTEWKLGDFPFYFVQICPLHNNDKNKEIQRLREAQFLTQELPNTGMVSTSDIGAKWAIHPPNKKDVGERLALWALAKNYSKNIVYSGPQYKSVEFKNGKAYLSFDYIGTGLEIKNDDGAFEIAGKDGEFFPAIASIEEDKIVLTSTKVPLPIKARYGWSNWVDASLFNKEGLSAPTFRTYGD